MKISVRVFPGSKKQAVEKTKAGLLKIYLKAPAKEEKANKELIKIISGYFDLPKSSVSIVLGKSSKNKVLEIN